MDSPNSERDYVVKNMYDPRNILETLYERLAAPKEGDAWGEEACALVDEYLGLIEEKERVSLAETREKLKKLVINMNKTLDVYEGDEFSGEDLDRLYDALTKAYFDPVQELLEGVIVAIAGN